MIPGTVAVQMGHVPRKTGATGTSGHRGTEQEFARQLAARIKPRVEAFGHRCIVVGADDPIPDCDVFVALHQDGSANPAARGASVGYPSGELNPGFAADWKVRYAAAGWPGGFRPDNYTSALRNYYAWKRTQAPVRILVEHGFATNKADADWMWDHLDRIAQVHADTIAWHLGAGQGDDDMTPQQAQQLEQIWGGLFGAVGGGPMATRIQEIHEGVRAVVCANPAQIPGGATLSDADVERVAVRVADLLAQRLGS